MYLFFYFIPLYLIFLFIIFIILSETASSHGSKENLPIELLSWDEAYYKAEKIVSRMSLKQKVDITTGTGWQKGLCVGNTFGTKKPNFPSLCLQDAPLGVSFADNVTAGVSGMNAAASFDKKAIYARAEYMGKEFRGKGVNVYLGPYINMIRVPEGGRNWEGGTEDPYLMGIVAAETVKGIQDQGVIASAKHFILNEQELNRNSSSSNIDARTLHEIYLWPFARVIEAGIGSIMCSFNKVNGTYACENDYLLNTILRKELGFRGFVCSDWFATTSTGAVKSGLDMNMPGEISLENYDTYFGHNLIKAAESKNVPEDRITDMANRIVTTWFKMRQDQNFPDTALNAFHMEYAPFKNVQENHKELVRELGAASNVLLKNTKNVLPLDLNKVKTAAIIGSDAGPNTNSLNCFLNGCTGGTLMEGWGSGTVYFPYAVDPLAGLTKAFGNKINIKSTLNDWDLQKAVEIARGADYAFVFSNSNSGEEIISVEDTMGDRNNLSLWHNGDKLINAVADVNNNTIVVIHSVGPVLMPWINHPNITAVLWPGLPGQESGNSLADVVTGKVNPSGRLPYTIGKNYIDYNAHINTSDAIEYSEKLLVGYKWFDSANIEPLFPFGYGLSYTKFDYRDLRVGVNASVRHSSTGSKTITDVTVITTIYVLNSGSVDGAEIVQAYLSFPDSTESPPKHLRGFEKAFLRRGEEKNILFELNKSELSIWDTFSNRWKIPSGNFTIHIGASSRDIREIMTFTI